MVSYEDYKKTELEAALDEHLNANRSSLSKEQKLADYYKRLSHPARSSPVKREPRGEVHISGDEVKKPTRSRRQTRPKEEIEATFVLT
jgi:hypothetical protein